MKDGCPAGECGGIKEQRAAEGSATGQRTKLRKFPLGPDKGEEEGGETPKKGERGTSKRGRY